MRVLFLMMLVAAGCDDSAISLGTDPTAMGQDGGECVSCGLHGASFSLKTVTTGKQPRSVATGDFNGDGHIDMIVGCQGGLSIFEGDGAGGFRAEMFRWGVTAGVLATGDFDRDGRLDLLVGNENGQNVPSRTLTVLLGNGDGTFHEGQVLGGGGIAVVPFRIVTGDLNEDGVVDVAYSTFKDGQYWLRIVLGNGDGTFGSEHIYQDSRHMGGVVAADLNGDGHVDLVVPTAGSGPDQAPDGAIEIYLGNGDGTLRAPVSVGGVEGGPCQTAAVLDFDRDGLLDLVAGTCGTNPDVRLAVSFLRGHGDGTFEGVRRFPVELPAAYVIAAADVDRDGVPDIVYPQMLWGKSVEVLLGDGAGNVRESSTPVIGPMDWVSMAIDDFDGDGGPDIAVTNQASDSVAILLNQTPNPQ